MIEHVFDLGTEGEVKIQDWSMHPEFSMCRFYIRSNILIDVPVSFRYAIDGAESSWESFDWDDATTDWQLIDAVYVGEEADEFVLYFHDTETTEMNGPADFTIDLGSDDAANLIDVKYQGSWERAEVYVRDNGEWKLVKPYVRTSGNWVETS